MKVRMKRSTLRMAGLAAAVVALFSCSTTKVLQDGEYRLAKNTIKVTNDKDFNADGLMSYVKQKSNSSVIFNLNPFLNVYNWQNGRGKGWDKFVRKIGVAPVIYNPDLVDKSVDNIRQHLEYMGWYDSKVNSEVSVKRKLVKVNYLVEVGKRYVIDSITVTLPDNPEFEAAFWKDRPNSLLQEGCWLSEELLDKEIDRCASVLRNDGFYTFSKNQFFFEADTLSHDGKAVLHLSVKEYTRNESEQNSVPIRPFYINEIDISYPQTLNFRQKALRNFNTIVPGSRYSEDAVAQTYERFSSIPVFNSVNIEMNQVDTNLVDCSIRLAQSKTQGFKVNLEASVNSSGLFGISPQVSYYHKNIFKGGERFNLSFMGDFQFRTKDKVRSNEFGVNAGLSFPKFLILPDKLFKGSIPRTDLNISYNYQDRPEYKRNVISTSYNYNGSTKKKLFYQYYPLQLSIIRLFALNPDFYESLASDPFMRNAYQDHFDLGASTTLYYTTNPSTKPRTTFFYTRFQFDLSGNLLSAFKPFMKKNQTGAGMLWNTPFSQYVRAEITVGKTWFLGQRENHSIATRFNVGAGWAYGNSTALPFEKHFYAGGANSMRGWTARSLGPGLSQRDLTFKIPNQTGDVKMEMNIEYRFPLFWQFDGAIFADAGNIWTLKDEGTPESALSRLQWNTLGDSIAADWGLGLRLDFDFLLIRLDWGMKVHDPARQNSWLKPGEWFKSDGYALHFGVGLPF